MRVCFNTLGCKVNQNETGALMQLFFENGFEIVNDSGEGAPADVYIVNSCTVTAGGDKKSRQWLRRCKRANPAAVTVLTGCYPQAFADACKDIEEADIITGTVNRSRLAAHVLQFMQDGKKIIDIVPHQKGEAFEVLPSEQFQDEGHTRAFLKIEDGCNRQCAYCIIPKARGNVRSRPAESIIEELNGLAAHGYREVVLSGINLTFYGRDCDSNLAEIVEKAAAVEGIDRIRLGSIEPDMLSDDILVRLAAVKKLCPQFHLSLQSGCNATLKRMNRHYTAEEYFAVVTRMRQLWAAPTFTTDVIVGFPGETEEEFAASLEFVKKLEFLKVHAFSYSRRPGTAAAEMPEQIDEQTKTVRNRILTQQADLVRQAVIARFAGCTEEVLLEKPISKDLFTGYTRTYIPALVKSKGGKQGQIVTVKINTMDGDRCLTDVLEGRNDE
ncbi:MAG: tRNA (N(6)-L-threonylcarbamoyladenosine(37)-C(2))-methylthiotransferase MtaB [Oscillospiraceae bacterium]|nr:tRNA (N(6)-L-threonylcarbamoyladenosine(37)-C(2))-methylthiotransferase MtaB [Oscillospiraceae bacterium]